MTGGSGGSGVVIVRYPGNVQFYTGGTVTYSNGYIVHNFTASGTLSPITTPTVVSDYQISRSLRFNSADSPYLSRTPGSTSNQKTATFSAWVKRGTLGSLSEGRIFAESTGSGAGIFWIFFNSSDQLQIYVNGSGTGLTSTSVFRDLSAWYHIVVAVDTSQAVASDRIKLYVNGVQITTFTGTQTYYSSGESVKFNVTSTTNYIGYSNTAAFNGYMTEINWIDGQQLTPTSFGYVSPTTGIWSPAKYVGGYGTNGFYLNFSDNSNTTAATLGKDYSGNGNNWTPNNFSVTAGVDNDSLVDSPTPYGTDTGVGGEVRGNYCTWNPLVKPFGTNTYTNGNLTVVPNGNWNAAVGTIGITSGKWYWEILSSVQDLFIGIQPIGQNYTIINPQDFNGVFLCDDNQKLIDGTRTSYTSTGHPAGTVVGVGVDLDAGLITFYINGVSQGAINYTSSASFGKTVLPTIVSYYAGYVQSANFGQRPFVYTAPSGFKALCTQNLPTPTIGATAATQAGKYFNPVTYTGTGTTNSITGVGFQPDWTWIKSRSNGAYHHRLTDAVRGVTKEIYSNLTNAEGTDSNGLTAFGSDGFTVGSSNEYNASATTFVAWNWNAGGSTVTNTTGSISAQVRANPTAGFSVVTYTGNSSASTVGHGLGAIPKMIIGRSRTNSGFNWGVWHTSLQSLYGNAAWIRLNTTDAYDTTFDVFDPQNNTSSVFGIGTEASMNANGSNYVAYCFAEVAGYSAFGSYTGNGSADGPFAYTGFRPRFLMIKNTAAVGADWVIYDSVRSTYNIMGEYLNPNLSGAAGAATVLDFLSNGFKLKIAGGGTHNQSTNVYIFAAFAESPFKYALAR